MSGYDVCVGVTRSLMSSLGNWPGREEAKQARGARLRLSFSLFLMVFFIVVPQTRMLLTVLADLNLVLDILTTADVIVALSCVKLFAIWYNRADLRKLLTEIEKDWKTQEGLEQQQQQAMWRNAKMCKIIMAGYASLTFGTIVIYTIRGLFLLYIYARQQNGYSNATAAGRRPMYVNSEFFFDTENSPTFEIVWAGQFLAGAVAAAAFTSFDGFFVVSVIHLSSQFAVLQTDIKSIKLTCLENSYFLSTMRLIIRRHLHLNSFTESVEKNFNKVFLAQTLCYSVSLCLQFYQLVSIISKDWTSDASATAFIVVFTMANIMSLFLYNFVADKLHTQNTGTFDGYCAIEWYKLQPKESRMLVTVMLMAKYPVRLTAGKFTVLSFEYFTQVIKTAGGYLSFLLAVQNRL